MSKIYLVPRTEKGFDNEQEQAYENQETIKMTNADTKVKITQAQLARIGEGIVGYVREIPSDELKGKFPSLPEIKPKTRLWALFAANGQPILFSDAKDHAIAGALENDLTTVPLH